MAPSTSGESPRRSSPLDTPTSSPPTAAATSLPPLHPSSSRPSPSMDTKPAAPASPSASASASAAGSDHARGLHHDNDHDLDHPFITFRRFADAQLAALLQGFVGLPSALDQHSTSSHLRDGEMDARNGDTEDEQQQQGRRSRWRGRGGRCMRHHHHHQQQQQQHAELHGDAEASLGSDPLRAANAAMLTHYLLHDAYSPLALETDPVLGRINWRAAFTELVGDSTGVAGNDGATHPAAPDQAPPREWALTTAQRWALHRQPPSGSGPVHASFVIGFPSLHALHAPWDRGLADTMHGLDHGPGIRNAMREKEQGKGRRTEGHDTVHHDADQPSTELDMYERFLDGVRPADSPRSRRREAATQTETSTPVPASAPVQKAESPKTETQLQKQAKFPAEESRQREPGLIAALTTTEQVVLPDGTTHTKVALKKRFSDGREERKETVHTSLGDEDRDWARIEAPSKSPETKHVSKPGATMDALNKEKEKRSRGWFWS